MQKQELRDPKIPIRSLSRSLGSTELVELESHGDGPSGSDSDESEGHENWRLLNGSSNALSSQHSVDNSSTALASASSSICSAASVIAKTDEQPKRLEGGKKMSTQTRDEPRKFTDSLEAESSPLTETTSVSVESLTFQRQTHDQLAPSYISTNSETSVQDSSASNKDGTRLNDTETTPMTSKDCPPNTTIEASGVVGLGEAKSRSLLTRQLSDDLHQKPSSMSSSSFGWTSKDVTAIAATRKASLKSPVDCPYVHDLLIVSSNLSESPVQPVQNIHQTRLSHEDTMEAIEDDVEGEELEMQQQQQQLEQHQGLELPQRDISDILSTPIPSGFRGPSDPESPCGSDRAVTPAESIKEEDGEELDDDDQPEADAEESSISVSQHGFVISQESPMQRSRQDHSPEDQQADSLQSVSEIGEQKRNGWPVKSMSNESATRAILEHIVKHNQNESVELSHENDDDKTLKLEHSNTEDLAGDDTLERRKSSLQHQGLIENKSLEVPQQNSQRHEVSNQFEILEKSETGTMRRRREETHSTEVGQSRSAIIRRGPPLKQLKGSNKSDIDKSQTMSRPEYENNDSICSSCSCREPDVSVGQGFGGPKSSAVGPSTSSQWMSHEEGTVYTDNYWLSHWLYVSEREESEVWRQVIDMPQSAGSEEIFKDPPENLISGLPRDMNEVRSTGSEIGFSMKYKSTTRKMIHRRATVEMYKRIMTNTLRCEKRIEISRSNGEFGFRIHGSRPVVVSAIERGTSAENCGLEVGDLIYAINGTNILDMAHSDVVKLAHSGK